MYFWRTILIISTILLTTSIISCKKPGNSQFVTIGTGGVTGVYYPTGGAISRIINKKYKEYKIKATVESTGGSVYNINAVLSGDLQFGVAQSDRQYQAYHGEKEWKAKGPQLNLRSVFSIHPESITLIASVNSKINKIIDLKGKKVNIGNPGSGQLGNSIDALNAFNVSQKDVRAEYVKAVEAPGLLQDERIDAFFYTVGHPNGNIKEATSGRVKVKLIAIEGVEVDTLISKYPYYAKSIILASMYPNAVNKENINTFGVKATFVTSTKVSKKVVYLITKEIFDNFEEFKKLHPAYQVLTKKGMLEGLSAPLHKGAIQYYTEAGLINFIDKKLLK